jgi:HTH-type transcriptional regulator/antitoxin HigA
METDQIAARVPAPGQILHREIEARGWTQKDLADKMGLDKQTLGQIVNGRQPITPKVARQLAAALGTSPDLWLGLEADYQRALTRNRG